MQPATEAVQIQLKRWERRARVCRPGDLQARMAGTCGLYISFESAEFLLDPCTTYKALTTYTQIECPRATERLRVSLPATIADPSSHPAAATHASRNSYPQPAGASGSQILLATENFITFLDALKLKMLSKDALHPLLAELIQSVNMVTDKDFEGRAKIISWLIKLNSMRAQEELNEGEARELVFEMEGAYAGFKKTLNWVPNQDLSDVVSISSAYDSVTRFQDTIGWLCSQEYWVL